MNVPATLQPVPFAAGYRLNAEIELAPIAGETGHYLAARGRHYHVGPELAELIRSMQALFAGRPPGHAAPPDHPGLPADAALAALLQLGVLLPDGPTASAPALPASRKSYINFQVDLAGTATVDALTRPFRQLFRPLPAAAALLAIVLAHAAFFYSIGELHLGGQRIVNALAMGASDFLVIYCAFLACIFFHEMGHAAAAAFHGIAPKRIGCGLYFIFPVMFADVTDSWRLAARKRMVINAGGIYFQLLANTLLIALWFGSATPDPAGPLAYVILLNMISVVHSLNPILRFDGYWLFSDALKIPNLRDAAWAHLRRLWRQPAQALGSLREVLLACYALVSAGFLFLYAWWFYDLLASGRLALLDARTFGALFVVHDLGDVLTLLVRLVYVAVYLALICVFARMLAIYCGYAWRLLYARLKP